MRVLVTGSDGYVGSVLAQSLRAQGHDVTGLDNGLYADDLIELPKEVPTKRCDIRDIQTQDLTRFEVIIHLAALSNDPLSVIDRAWTKEINIDATIRLANLARAGGVKRFLFASSCSVYGDSGAEWVDEDGPCRPLTPYAESKLVAERELLAVADKGFTVQVLRNATAFGYSPSLRTDVVVNDLVAAAELTGKLVLRSTGNARRPLVHVYDMARAFCQLLAVPAEQLQWNVLNVGTTSQNYTVLEIAQAVASAVPGAVITFAEGAANDKRSYAVRFSRLDAVLPEFGHGVVSLQEGIRGLQHNYRRVQLREPQRYVRIEQLKTLRSTGRLDSQCRVT